MDDSFVTQTPSRPDIFANTWVSCLFVPLVVLYVNFLLLAEAFVETLQLVPFLKDVIVVLGFGLSTLLLFGVHTASKYSKNDFIAGPIEVFNLYTFFFLGLMKGGLGTALIYTFLYQILETFGVDFLFIKVKSISNTEWEKAQRLGVQKKYFRLYQYYFTPIATISSLLIGYSFANFLIELESILDMGFEGQIKVLTTIVVVWKLCETLLHSIFSKQIPSVGCLSFWFLGVLLLTTYRLNNNDLSSWFWYLTFVIGGWGMVTISSTNNARNLA